MKPLLLIPTTPIKQRYNELVYLASFYRWEAQHSCNATGSRSPLNGKQYTISADPIHHRAHKASQISMAKSYFKDAAKLRKEIIRIYTEKGIHII